MCIEDFQYFDAVPNSYVVIKAESKAEPYFKHSGLRTEIQAQGSEKPESWNMTVLQPQSLESTEVCRCDL